MTTDPLFDRMFRDFLDAGKDEVRTLWDRISDDDKELAKGKLRHLARIQVAALQGEDVTGDMLDITARLANLKAQTAIEVRKAILGVFNRSIDILSKMARGFQT